MSYVHPDPSQGGAPIRASTNPPPEHVRDAIYQLLRNARHDLDGALSSLHNDDDCGLQHHARRMFDALRLAHGQLRALAQNGGRAA